MIIVCRTRRQNWGKAKEDGAKAKEDGEECQDPLFGNLRQKKRHSTIAIQDITVYICIHEVTLVIDNSATLKYSDEDARALGNCVEYSVHMFI
jgi:hypothetical protein